MRNPGDPNVGARGSDREVTVSANDNSDTNSPSEEVIEISSDSDAAEVGRPRNRGEREAFEDEDPDDSREQLGKRKRERPQQAPSASRRKRINVENASLVGRKPKTAMQGKDKKQKRGDRVYEEEADDEEVLLEDTLPTYLKERRARFNQRRAELEGAKGLLLPPDYDDVEFSDDERMQYLQERPQLPKEMLQRKYEDIQLRYSAGIVPAPIAQYLRPYQIDGAEFLHELFVFQKGGILGDDMGLGKTIQVIAFLTAAFGKTGDERDWKRMRKIRRMDDDRWYPRVLVIAPGGLMANWKNELDRWGWWHVAVYHGSKADKESALEAALRGRLEIMITTYESYRLNSAEINAVRWDAVVADECHKLKEPRAEITKAMHEVNALCRIGMTGTAIQNKYEELWTLLNWTNPGNFGPLAQWKDAICLPLKIGQSHDATLAQLARARRTATKLVKNLLPPFFLRRTKALIAHQLPKKSDRVVFCPLTDTQSEAYDNFCDSEIVRTIRDSSQPCTCGSGKKQGWCCYAEVPGQEPPNNTWQHFVFPALVTLQKLANHVALLIPASDADQEKHDRDVEKLATALPHLWQDLYRQRESIMNFANQEFCGKWRVLKKLLKLWHSNGDKVLVFSHSVRLLRMLDILFKATTSYNVSYLDGSMPYADRQTAVDEYNSDPNQFVFLISTKAGGVGLNITSANKVVVVDPNWNPAYDLQAQDRAYRIGQTRDVEVFRLISKGTVEEIVYARQIYKQQQANIGYSASVERRYFKGVQDQKGMNGEIFGLENLFAPMAENVVLREIVNKTNVAETRAGVEIAGLDIEATQDGEGDEAGAYGETKEDSAISQIAADIVGESSGKKSKASCRDSFTDTARKKDPVSAILASVGVEYTHENAEVIGTSKIEMKISSRAQKAGNDVDLDHDRASGNTASQSEAVPHRSSHSPVSSGTNSHSTTFAAYGAKSVGGTGRIRHRYRPPEDVRRRQFCEMARWAGFSDVAEFALVVEAWTQEQRRDCLETFYRWRRDKLAADDTVKETGPDV